MTTIKGHEIPTDESGRVNLTEIWKRAGGKETKSNRRPGDFKRLKRVRLMLAIADWLAKRGKLSSSWAHQFIAIEYAEYVGLNEIPATRPRTHFDEVWEKHLKNREEYVRDQAAQQESCRKQAAEDQERHEKFQADMEEWSRSNREWHNAMMEYLDSLEEDRAGEEWKGDDQTTGEEWKGEAEPAGPDPAGAWRSPHDLFFEFINIPGALTIRASVN